MAAKPERILKIRPMLAEQIKKLNLTEEKIEQYVKKYGVVHLFDDVSDPREDGKVIYSLTNILILAFLTIASEGSAAFLRMQNHTWTCRRRYRKLGLIEGEVTPSHDTFRRVLSLVSADEIYEATINKIGKFLKRIADSHPDYMIWHIEADGKEVRSTGRSVKSGNPSRNVNMVNFYVGNMELCVKSIPVHKKSNEIPIVQEVLKFLNLARCIITVDALHTQKETAKIIAENGGWYATPVKMNHENFCNMCKDMFESGNYDCRLTECGREGRNFKFFILPENWNKFGFDSAVMIVRMESYKHDKNNPEIMYFVTNTLDRILVMEAIENRWGIEGGFHKDKDSGYINEDEIRYQNENALKVVVALNNLIAGMARLLPAFNEKMNLPVAKDNVHMYPLEILCAIMGLVTEDDIFRP